MDDGVVATGYIEQGKMRRRYGLVVARGGSYGTFPVPSWNQLEQEA